MIPSSNPDSSPCPTPADLEEAPWRTPIANRILEDYNHQYVCAPDSMLYGYDVLTGAISPPEGSSEDPVAWLIAQPQQYKAGLRLAPWNRRILATRTGYLGLGPLKLAPGDWVCILLGADVPYVLRNTGDVDGQWKLVGECYLHGIIDGEFIEKDPVIEKFELR